MSPLRFIASDIASDAWSGELAPSDERGPLRGEFVVTDIASVDPGAVEGFPLRGASSLAWRVTGSPLAETSHSDKAGPLRGKIVVPDIATGEPSRGGKLLAARRVAPDIARDGASGEMAHGENRGALPGEFCGG